MMEIDTCYDKENIICSDIINDERQPTISKNENSNIKGDPLHLKFVWNKQTYDIDSLGMLNSVLELREKIKEKTGIPIDNQKLMFKGLVKDDSSTLKDINVINNSKFMVVGSTAHDIETIKTISPHQIIQVQQADAASSKEPLCKQKMHLKVLEKGKPDDVPPGIKGLKEKLPEFPLSGFINKAGGKVRLTFKLEMDQLWLGTKERTEKLPMSSIRNVISEPIEGHEEYHILALQLGPTEASRYWMYWFPAQYVDAVKDTILGKWQVL
ncbi:ubiquitin domain-containing protein UBFD1 isoform X2 [Hydra vulgaris]|uniref:Ubiquitin domain-containing protein UBFD1 isoform X2 n=1 Tax=Hydra vulgaris TaxID=6087 RepID=A0ABM4CCP3_HYDVU